MAQVTLRSDNINSSTAVKLLNGEVSYSWKNLTNAEPTVDDFGSTEVQFNGWENPAFTLTFHIPNGSIPTGTMTWGLWNQFVKNKYDGTDSTKVYLNILTGNGTQFTDYSADETSTSVSDIPVVIRGYSVRFGGGDSRDGYFWTINAQVQVTK